MKKRVWIICLVCLLMCGFTKADECGEPLTKEFGNIHDSRSVYGAFAVCWKIHVPRSSFIRLDLTKFTHVHGCSVHYIWISVEETGEHYKLCGTGTNGITALGNVTVKHLSTNEYYSYSYEFKLEYKIRDIICIHNDSFRCTEYSCIPKSQVCDGVRQCANGMDEVGCETGILAIAGVEDARKSGAKWLESKRLSSWGWGENTPRAVVALFLADFVNFNGTNLEEELMAKQTELKTSLALLRSVNTNNELSMFVNALLVTCHDPRHFYGNNLVRRLKTQVEEADGFIHPLAYLSLCNAHGNWPAKAIPDLENVLNSSSNYPFVAEIQAMAVMALSCLARNSKNSTDAFDLPTSTLYEETVGRFKALQLEDGSFGNVYTSSLITQALISSDNEFSTDWNLNSAIAYLMKEINSNSADFLTTYLILPILNRKSLVDVSKVNCSANPNNYVIDVASEISDHLGIKISVQYSLYIGDEKDVIHTIFLRVPENFTAFDVMEAAENEDHKYNFKSKEMSGKHYVYEICNITNDLEVGKFWLQYLTASNNTPLVPFTHCPDEFVMKNEDHLIMWYKTASL